MANLLNMELARLRESSNAHYIKGNYSRAIDSLQAMWMTAVHVMTQEERDKIEEMLNVLNIELMAVKFKGSFNDMQGLRALEAEMRIRKAFPKINEVIMDALFEHGFLGGMKKDASKVVRVKYD